MRAPLLSVGSFVGALVLLSPDTVSWGSEDDVISFKEIAVLHREVIVPIPSEVFNVLDRFEVTRNDWRRQIVVPDKDDCQNRTHFALFLGRVVAEGFLAVEAEDENAVQSLGRQVLSVAEELGLRDVVIKHSKSIIEEAERGNWDAVREEFDATHHTVREEMERRRDQDLSHCVSVGGWIRGTEIITAIIEKRYAPKTSEILYQPQLLEHFTTTFKANPRFQNDPRMRTIIEKLEELTPLMAKNGVISLDRVRRIHAICQKLSTDTLSP